MSGILSSTSQHPHHHQTAETHHLDNRVDNYVIEELSSNSLGFGLNCPTTKVFTSRKTKVIQKLAALRSSGIHKLKVVSDFDYTMTKFWIDGTKKASSCHKIIEDCGMLTHEYHTQAEVLEKKYYPLENDPTISIPDKARFMEEWAHNSRKLLVKSGLTDHVVRRAVEKAMGERAAELREGVDHFMVEMDTHRVPMLIFSAGIADVLEDVLQQSIQYDVKTKTNVFVVSNRCIFQDKADPSAEAGLAGFSMPIIHVFNKKSSSFLESPFFTETDERLRDNVILIGDSIGDLLMVEGMSHNPTNLLRIGFLNTNIEERLKQYTDMYDIVIAGRECTFEVPLAIVESIIASTALARPSSSPSLASSAGVEAASPKPVVSSC